MAARLPPVLCLQLRRGFWSPSGHYCKVTGHVAFPLHLAMPRGLVPLLGHGAAPPGAAAAAEAAAGEAAAVAVPCYALRAVIVHHGALAGHGHYTVFRRLDSSSSGSSDCGGDDGVWVRASDETVAAATPREVLDAEAALLLFERCQPGCVKQAA